MIACQNCGATNETGRVECRRCGRALTAARSGAVAPCAACGEPLGEDDLSCPVCGAPVPATEVGAGPALPNWLERAAPPAAAAMEHPIGESPQAADGDRIKTAPSEAPADQSLPSLPDGGLAAAMPNWLRRPPDTSPAGAREAVTLVNAAAPAAGPPPPSAPVPSDAAATTEATDPTSFIGEDDLPTWIRQLVANERADDDARPAATAPAAAPAAAGPRPAPTAGEPTQAPAAVPVAAKAVPATGRGDQARRGILWPVLLVLVVVLIALAVLAYVYTSGLR